MFTSMKTAIAVTALVWVAGCASIPGNSLHQSGAYVVPSAGHESDSVTVLSNGDLYYRQ